MNAKEPGSFRPLLRSDGDERIASMLRSCMNYIKNDDDAEGEEDLSYGRPSIQDLRQTFEGILSSH